MRARRTVYIVIFLVASVVAAGVYYLAQPRLELVRAKVDIPVLTQINSDMVELVRVSPLDAPQGTARSVDAVVGRYAALPILAGQDVDTRAIEATPGSRAFGFGAPLAPGQVAFALPVAAEQAVGGALSAGAKVDIIAVPNSLKTVGVSSNPGPPAVMMGQGLTILALRTTDGHPLGDDTSSSSSTRVVVPPKLGSVVVAIPAARLADFATASLTSSFYLALDPAPPGATVTP
jgi:Flp pilus assembly protein CpaB